VWLGHLAVLSHADADSCELVQIFDGQAEQVVVEAPTGLIVALAVGTEHAAVKHLRKSLHVALLQGGLAILPALFGGLVGDGPIGIDGSRDALDTLKHVALSKSEARYVDGAVAELRQRERPVRLVVLELLQTQQIDDSSTALRPSDGVDSHVAVVEQDEGALLEIKAVAIRSGVQAKLVPEVADQQQVRADVETLDLSADAVALRRSKLLFCGQASYRCTACYWRHHDRTSWAGHTARRP